MVPINTVRRRWSIGKSPEPVYRTRIASSRIYCDTRVQNEYVHVHDSCPETNSESPKYKFETPVHSIFADEVKQRV